MSGDFLFAVFALATCLSAVAVVCSQTVVRMAFWLVISLGSTAALFFLANADFVGAAQLLIYVGGTLVLLVFGVMLTASGPYMKIATSAGETVVAGLLGLLFLFVVLACTSEVVWRSPGPVSDQNIATGAVGTTLRPLGLSFLGVRPDVVVNGEDKVEPTGYLLPFEIVSVHLLVVLIGASYLARAKRRADPVS
jgi:NADH:ubiquinone oxidoreductase subunit 6 (subunit J)